LTKDVIAKWGADHSKLRSERVAIRDGISVEYVHTPMLSGNNNVMGAHELTGQSARIALVWNGEMYDARIGPEWRHIAAGFNLPHVHSVVSVFIHIPDDAAVRNGPYRLDLRPEAGDRIEVEDFSADVRNAMPTWVRDLVSEALRPLRATDMSAVRKELERRLRDARIRPVDLNRPGTQAPTTPRFGQDTQADTTLDAYDAAGPQPRAKPKSVNAPTILDPDASADDPGHKQQKNQTSSPIKRRRAVQSVTSAPEIIWFDTPEAVTAEDLADRAGKYNADTNTLYLNALYDAVDGKIAKLEAQYAQQVDWDSIRGLVIDKVRAAMALHIGSVVVYALAKQGRANWKDADWKRAMEPESLTVAADQSDYVLGDIRSALGATAQFKAARVV